MTPLLGHDWMFDKVYEKRNVCPGYRVQVDMDDNPHLNQEAKERLLEGLTDEERRPVRKGASSTSRAWSFPNSGTIAHGTASRTRG
jgi:hypothetical protein